ncbi:MAG: hypothetical protein LBU42_03305 [Prevotellaceae bacterium]|jgi:hypothetical protein|nr:hypothetical protein [Prevotellaceae bacterium]
MATLSIEQLKANVATTFPTNGQGLIQAANHRSFLTDLIDTLGTSAGGATLTNVPVAAIEDEYGKSCTFSSVDILRIGGLSFLLIKGLQKKDLMESFSIFEHGTSYNLVDLYEMASNHYGMCPYPVKITGSNRVDHVVYFSIPSTGGGGFFDYVILFIG